MSFIDTTTDCVHTLKLSKEQQGLQFISSGYVFTGKRATNSQHYTHTSALRHAEWHTYNRSKLWLLHTCLEPAHHIWQLLLLLLPDEMREGTGQGCGKLAVSYGHSVTDLQ